MIQFITNLPDFSADMHDVIRLFYGNTPISADEGEMKLTHEHAEADGKWLETVDGNPWQILKTFECFLYQCNEGAAAKSELYQALVQAKNHYMHYLVNKLPEYAAAVWG